MVTSFDGRVRNDGRVAHFESLERLGPKRKVWESWRPTVGFGVAGVVGGPLSDPHTTGGEPKVWLVEVANERHQKRRRIADHNPLVVAQVLVGDAVAGEEEADCAPRPPATAVASTAPPATAVASTAPPATAVASTASSAGSSEMTLGTSPSSTSAANCRKPSTAISATSSALDHGEWPRAHTKGRARHSARSGGETTNVNASCSPRSEDLGGSAVRREEGTDDHVGIDHDSLHAPSRRTTSTAWLARCSASVAGTSDRVAAAWIFAKKSPRARFHWS